MQHGGIVYMQERIAFVDVYSEYLIITGIETDRSNATVLKHIKAFTKHPDFTNHYNNLPFTLILHKYKEVSEQINQKIAPFKGSIIFNDPLVAQIIEPVVRELYNNMVHKKTSHC
ncbi:MAG TPA: hypothetical protein DCQ26_08065 [Marinilabiliales bacterium]|nr:MAG: hypothetical protein A2W96_10640 [Bacteroidetes bacterium GWD2_40_43]OFX95628.1 MAG: hypothetical protein A2W97_00960 [Bacteroidetes bacterium GWE2_40_63]OFY22176.1 MAG: hypothetical protein A2W88_05555 [Bacteroidetes bacterium GWF2_40_13]OFZ23548.1 MAG: hypothetical protein A2437_11090 [Bacteroidetes bacterium RIFOXYC2_FULL_40_12]HAM98555.1 hypothetical protein [Marinilabiliales bacterium]